MLLNAVRYELENWKGITASKCALFTDTDTSYIPIGRIIRTGGIQKCLDCYDSLGTEFGEQLRSMIGFRFKRHPSLNLPEEHLQALEKLLEIRTRKLLAIPVRTRSSRGSKERQE